MRKDFIQRRKEECQIERKKDGLKGIKNKINT
jgi:hypothetical protein